jgi:hypothetical protein
MKLQVSFNQEQNTLTLSEKLKEEAGVLRSEVSISETQKTTVLSKH